MGMVQFRVTLLAFEIVLVIVLVIGFSTVSITSTASLSTSTKTGQAGCYPYRHLCEPGQKYTPSTKQGTSPLMLTRLAKTHQSLKHPLLRNLVRSIGSTEIINQYGPFIVRH